jgi:activator of HSP90 ATPase
VLCVVTVAPAGCAPPHAATLQTLIRLRGGAEVGKGDRRWIVKDREDGKNVGAWHWEERDMMIWTREQLPQIALGASAKMEFEGYTGHYEITNITTIKGDCVIHLRKGRLWPLCDLNIAMAVKGDCEKDGKISQVSGTITFPEVTMDDRDDLQREATTTGGGEASEVFGRWLRKEGYKAAEKTVQLFLDALSAKAGTQFTCFTSTNVQILKHKALSAKDQPPEMQEMQKQEQKMKEALAAAEKMAKVNKVMASDVPTPTDDHEDHGPPSGSLQLQAECVCVCVCVCVCLLPL